MVVKTVEMLVLWKVEKWVEYLVVMMVAW